MTPITALEAERLAGKRLDRRLRYFTYDKGEPDPETGDVVHVQVKYSTDCGGCTEHGEYGTKSGPFGCESCGHTGRRRVVDWLPLSLFELIQDT